MAWSVTSCFFPAAAPGMAGSFLEGHSGSEAGRGLGPHSAHRSHVPLSQWLCSAQERNPLSWDPWLGTWLSPRMAPAVMGDSSGEMERSQPYDGGSSQQPQSLWWTCWGRNRLWLDEEKAQRPEPPGSPDPRAVPHLYRRLIPGLLSCLGSGTLASRHGQAKKSP